jgi:translation initiation factor IF-3
MRFKGREMSNDLGRNVLNNIIEDLEGLIKVDSEPKMEGRQMMMMVSPA